MKLSDFERKISELNSPTQQTLVRKQERLTRRTLINDAFFDKMEEDGYIKEETVKEIKQIIQEDSFLHKVYTTDRLFISTGNRIKGLLSVRNFKSDMDKSAKDDKSMEALERKYNAIKSFYVCDLYTLLQSGRQMKYYLIA